MSGDHVDDAARDKEGRNLFRAARLGILLVVCLDRIQAADAGAHRHADPRTILRGHHDARILHGIGCGGVAVMHEGIHLAQVFGGEIFLRIEPVHGAAEAHRKGANVEASDRADAALPREHAGPRRIDRATDGRNDTQTGHDHASLRQALTSLQMDEK
jgi:hypothetical protein